MPRPLVHYPHALADHQPDGRPVLGGALEDAARLVKVIVGVEHQLDPQPVFALLLDFVEVAAVGVVQIAGLFVGPVAHKRRLRCTPFRQPRPGGEATAR